MNNQIKQLIDKETFVNFLKSEINNWSGSDIFARVRVDSLQWVIDRIENNNAQVGLIDTPPVPTIKPGDKHRCPCCNIASTQQEWDESTNKAYNGDAATIHDCKTLNLLALFACPVCGEEAELHQMEVVE